MLIIISFFTSFLSFSLFIYCPCASIPPKSFSSTYIMLSWALHLTRSFRYASILSPENSLEGRRMKQLSYQVRFGIAMVLLSATTYFIHYLIFRDLHHIFIYFLGDIAFVFIEVLLVILIIHNILDQREKASRLEKLNTVIGVFFSETGTELLTYFSNLDPNLEKIRQELLVQKNWTEKEFSMVLSRLKNYTYQVSPGKLDIDRLGDYLSGKRDFFLMMMENPNLMEHENFTELLRALFHLAEELKFRTQFVELPDSDIAHIAGDIDRAYAKLVSEWLSYMGHLKDNFPYFFSLALRTNPFDRKATVIVSS